MCRFGATVPYGANGDDSAAYAVVLTDTGKAKLRFFSIAGFGASDRVSLPVKLLNSRRERRCQQQPLGVLRRCGGGVAKGRKCFFKRVIFKCRC